MDHLLISLSLMGNGRHTRSDTMSVVQLPTIDILSIGILCNSNPIPRRVRRVFNRLPSRSGDLFLSFPESYLRVGLGVGFEMSLVHCVCINSESGVGDVW
jgi:hypothetical protein